MGGNSTVANAKTTMTLTTITAARNKNFNGRAKRMPNQLRITTSIIKSSNYIFRKIYRLRYLIIVFLVFMAYAYLYFCI